MEELIRVNYDSGEPRISARELHEKLGIDSRFNVWFPRTLNYGFQEGLDYSVVQVQWQTTQGNTTTGNDYLMSVDMAKQICMVQRSEKGRQYRQYFLQLERYWNSPEVVIQRGMKFLTARVEELEAQNLLQVQQLEAQRCLIEVMEPKVRYLDQILQSKSLVTMTQVAKDYGMSARQMNQILKEHSIQYKSNGQWVLYAKYQGKGYVHSQTYLIPENGEAVMHTLWTPKGREFLYYLLKELGILPTVERVGE